MDRIEVGYKGTDVIDKVFCDEGDFISKEVLAKSIAKGVDDGYTKDWVINGEKTTLSVKKV